MLDALQERDDRLGVMYIGALQVLRQRENPDRFALCAHGIREILEKLPEYLDLPLERKDASLTAKVRELQNAWSKVAREADGAEWMTKGVERFLKVVVAQFFAWFERHQPKRVDRVKKIFRGLDPGAGQLPPPIEDLRLKEWDRFNDYFQDVSHHRVLTTDAEIENWLTALERFLLDRLKPRTFEDHAEIDKLIAEGEADA